MGPPWYSNMSSPRSPFSRDHPYLEFSGGRPLDRTFRTQAVICRIGGSLYIGAACLRHDSVFRFGFSMLKGRKATKNGNPLTRSHTNPAKIWISKLPGLVDQYLAEDTVFPDLPVRICRKTPSSRTCRSASAGRRRLPGLAGLHLPEDTVFPDLPVCICRKTLSSRTCRSASAGRHCPPGLAGLHLPEDTVLPDLPVVISRNALSSPTCPSSSAGNRRHPGLAGPHLPEDAVASRTCRRSLLLFLSRGVFAERREVIRGSVQFRTVS